MNYLCSELVNGVCHEWQEFEFVADMSVAFDPYYFGMGFSGCLSLFITGWVIGFYLAIIRRAR